MSLRILFLVFIAVLALPKTTRLWADDAEKPISLSDDDKKHLDRLFQDFLFDPKGAERVAFKSFTRTVWDDSVETDTEGWLVAGKDGKPGRVYFTDGASIPAPPIKDLKKVDFKAACKARYELAIKKPAKDDDPNRDEVFRKMRQTAIGALVADDLVIAAWLYKLGDEPLAAKALAVARTVKGDPATGLRQELAWSAFAGMVHAYMVRADDEALEHGERLLRLYPDEAKGDEFRQAAKIVDELKRRKKKGTFGKTPGDEWPDGFDAWDAKKKTAYLIDSLDEVDARQWGQPGGVDMASDRRVEALIRLGEAAVPALIDAFESDERLTRSVHFWRDFARSRTVLNVREAELTALMSILRVHIFEPAATGDNFTSRGEEKAKETANRLRAYWKQYGHLPFDERMMKILTDPKTSFEAKREAADNLGAINEDRRLRTTIHPTVIGGDPPKKLNPVIGKFSKPTVAEAILSAMDSNLKDFDLKPKKEDPGYQDYLRSGIEGTYLSALVSLGDERISPELAKRSVGAATVNARRLYASAALDLGDPKPFRSLADDFRTGKLPLSDKLDDLRRIIRALSLARIPESNRALEALVDPKHPQHSVVAEQILTKSPSWTDDQAWFAHPFCLSVLRAALDDNTPTGTTVVIEENSLRRKTKNGWSGSDIPGFLADPSIRNDQVPERRCDAAAEKLNELMVGLPFYHPLFKDADKRRVALKAAFDRFTGHYRGASWREREILSKSHRGPLYIPDISPLAGAATAGDVKVGKAVFHLDGTGKLANLKLPAVGTVKSEENKERPTCVLILQAEVGADGQAVYGVLTKDSIRTMPASELTGIKSFEQLDREEKEAVEKEELAKELKRLEGVWFTTPAKQGRDRGNVLAFQGGRLYWNSFQTMDGEPVIGHTKLFDIKLNMNVTPHQITATIVSKDEDKEIRFGIYEVNGDRMMLAFGHGDETKRPKKFDEEGINVFRLEKNKKAKVPNLERIGKEIRISIEPTTKWTGTVGDAALAKQCPEKPITTPVEFEMVWKLLRGKEEIPKVDFTKEFIVVRRCTFATVTGFRITIVDDEVDTSESITSREGEKIEGFTYFIGRFSDDRVEVIDGKFVLKSKKK